MAQANATESLPKDRRSYNSKTAFKWSNALPESGHTQLLGISPCDSGSPAADANPLIVSDMSPTFVPGVTTAGLPS